MSYQFDSLTAATAASIGTSSDSVCLAGYAKAGDGGEVTYHRYGSSAPPHPGYFRSADGTFCEMVGPVFDVRAFGVIADFADVSTIPGVQQADGSSPGIVTIVQEASDDYQRFQNALTTAYVLDGGVVEFGPANPVAPTLVASPSDTVVVDGTATGNLASAGQSVVFTTTLTANRTYQINVLVWRCRNEDAFRIRNPAQFLH